MEGEIQANNSSPKLVEPKVKTSAAVWLGVANASTGLLCAFAEGTALTYFYHNFLGLNEWVSGLIWILFGIWNAINDPLYGFLADRTKSKLGRRRPWIRYGAPIMAVLFAITWISFPAMRGNQWFLGFQMGLSLFLYDIVYTAIASAIYVMPYEMAVTDNARSPIFVWNVAFSLISFGAPMVLNGMLTTLIETHANIFPWAMAAAGLVAGALVFVSTFFYKNPKYEDIPDLTAKIEECLEGSEIATLSKIGVVIDEVMNNIISYGKTKTNKTLMVTAEKRGDEIVLVFIDNSHPFNPLLKPKHTIPENMEKGIVGGVGISIVTSISKDAEYAYSNNKNILIIKF